MNIIVNHNDDIIGYKKDLKEYLESSVKECLEKAEYSCIEELVESLQLLQEIESTDSLLILSENNGMGVTINNYKGE